MVEREEGMGNCEVIARPEMDYNWLELGRFGVVLIR